MQRRHRKSRKIFCFAACCLAAFAARGAAQEEIDTHYPTKSDLLFEQLFTYPQVDLAAMEKLLDEGANPNARNRSQYPTGRPALVVAIKRGLAPTRLLIEHGADVNIRAIKTPFNDDPGFTPLMVAVFHMFGDFASASDGSEAAKQRPDTLEITKLLLEKHADVNARSQRNATALILAAGNGIYIEGRLDRNSPIKTSIVSLLLKAGANVNARSESGTTALFQAIRTQSTDTAKMLIAAGADKNSKNAALREAVRLSYPDPQNFPDQLPMIRLLLESKADPNAFDNAIVGDLTSFIARYNIDFHDTTRTGIITRVLHLLLDNGAVVNNAKGTQLLKWSVENKQTALVSLLEQHGAKLR